MKSKTQKGEELKKGKEFLERSSFLAFVDFSKVSAEDLRKLRRELKSIGANLLVIKKRLLNILLKEKGADIDVKKLQSSIGTIFSSGDIEKTSGPVYKFFAGLDVPEGGDKRMWINHIVGGYNVEKNHPVSAEDVIFIGSLPPREVLLAQLLGMIAAPVRSLLYLMDQRSKTMSK